MVFLTNDKKRNKTGKTRVT